jgi:predicted glycosyltransferase
MSRMLIVVTHLLGARHLLPLRAARSGGDRDGAAPQAERLNALGWGEMIPDVELSSAALAAAVGRALECPRHGPVPTWLDGADRTVVTVEGRLQRSAR